MTNKPLFTLDQFLAMATLLNEKLAEVESLRETNDMLSYQLAERAERRESLNSLDERNDALYEANVSLAKESEGLETRNKYLNDLVLHQNNQISNLQGHVRDLKQELSRFTCPIDEEAVKAEEEEANWAKIESILTPAHYASKVNVIKVVREVLGIGLRKAKEAAEMRFYDSFGALLPKYAQNKSAPVQLGFFGIGEIERKFSSLF